MRQFTFSDHRNAVFVHHVMGDQKSFRDCSAKCRVAFTEAVSDVDGVKNAAGRLDFGSIRQVWPWFLSGWQSRDNE